MPDEALFREAIKKFDDATTVLMQYQRTLEDRIKLLTQEVDRKKQLLDSILNSIDIGVIFFDEEGKIQVVNKIACSLLSTDVNDLINQRTLPADIQEDKILPHNGKAFDALVSRLDVTDSNKQVIGNVLIFKDITRIKKLEADNERNRRLSAMGELILKIAHEIRNPLGSIELFASLLKQDLKGSEQGAYAERISHSVMSLVNTLDNMLRYSKGIKPTFKKFDFSLLINELYVELSQTFKSAKINFNVGIQTECLIEADRDLLRQALINIIVNAIQAMPNGGDLNLQIHNSNVNLVFTINDTGKGMDAETLSRIFEPFYSTKDRGTGLGMSITQSIIEAHRGSITVQSEPGKGSEFKIVLPKGIK